MLNIEDQLKLVAEQTVICVGDLMLDDFVYGEVSRISPEAPAPVLAAKKNELVVGGAGNVARNIAALGARCIFVGVVGDDEAGRTLKSALRHERRIKPHLVIDPSRPSTRKVRFVSEHYSTHLLRADWEVTTPIGEKTEAAVINHVLEALPHAASLVLSDYAKGVLTKRVVRTLIQAARKLGKPVIVDPKGKDFSIYRGATMITPNRQELAAVTVYAVDTDSDIVAAAMALNRAIGTKAVLVTRSEAGMTLVAGSKAPVQVPAYAVKVRDVTGAGDTVAAVLSAMLAAGADFEDAMRAANAAAAVVVGKRGTATVTPAELRGRLLPAASRAPEEKIVFDWSVLDERIGQWRRQGLRVGFTNGCFDLLHPGHVKLLAEARAACDRLVVGLNDDASVKRLKGKGRPLQVVHARAEVLAALEAVDLVVVFPQDTPLELIRRLKPTVLVKGGDYRKADVVGGDLVEAQGGEVMLVDLVAGYSTTRIVNSTERSGQNFDGKPRAKRR